MTIAAEMERLGIGIRPKPGPEELEAIFAEVQDGTDRPVQHLLRDEKTTAGLRELATGLVIDFVVDASKAGGRAREMLFGINRFEETNAPGHPYEGRVPATWRRFGASMFLDEATGAVHVLASDDSARLDDAQIATLVGDDPDAVRRYTQAQEFMGFQRGAPKKVADSLQAFLAQCAPCDDSSPGNDDYPKYE